ncbi:MAG: glycosyltransferase [Gammaproteobacteria bacterium]|jgi:GT2 family glycosyltransferase|nr:glycosyltransferase [Gammaproteobacteria bacterium]
MPMTDKPIASNFTVVIPTLGRPCLRDSVLAIAAGTLLPAEIILSHQGAVGSMDAMMRDFGQLEVKVRYLHSDQRGAAAGRNTGIRHVTTEFFASTDDDCNVAPQWLEEIVFALEQHPRAIVTGRVLASEAGAPSTNNSTATRVFKSLPLKGDHFAGGNFGTAVAVFNDAGPFDETELLRYCEDPEWSYRALVKGYEIRFIPAITVTHLHWRDAADMTQVYSQYAYSTGGWFGRRIRRFDGSFIVRLLYELIRGGKRWCLGSIRGDLLRKVNGRAYVVDLLRGVAAGWNGH